MVPRPRADRSELSVLDEAAQYQSDMRGVVGDRDGSQEICRMNLNVFVCF